MKRIIRGDSNDIYRNILRWLTEMEGDRMPAKALASDLGITLDNFYQRVSRLKRMKGKRIVSIRAGIGAVPG